MCYKGENMRITIDSHNDTLMKIIDPESWAFKNDIGQPTPFHIDLDKMEKGQTNVAFFAAYTDDLGHPNLSNSYLFSMMAALEETVALNSDRFTKVKTLPELQLAIASGKRVAIQSVEGGYGLYDVNARALLEQYRDIGVRMLTLVWDYSNALGEGTLKQHKSGDETSGGLTPLGKKAVRWMEELGIIVDVSHMDEETFWSTVEVARKPLVASHSGAHAILPHVRNLKDDQILAVAKSGGVVSVVFCRYFIGDETAGVETLLDHIEHVIKVAGVDYVGLGSDFDGATMPVDLPDMAHMQLVAEGLAHRGYSTESIDKIMGGNMLRILEATMKSEDGLSSDHSIDFDAVTLSMAVEAINAHKNPVGWVNGIEVPCQYNAETKKIIYSGEWIPDQRFFIVTMAYENMEGLIIRQTTIVKHPTTSA